MKNKKVLLSGMAALSAISATVVPLMSITSCGNKSQNDESLNYDEKYGVDNYVYTTLENKFKSAVESAIDTNPKIRADLKQIYKERAYKALNTFRTKLNELVANENTKPYAYTAVSNAMIDFAQETYDIRLNRETNATLSDIDRIYEGLYNSWKISMQNSGISPAKIESILSDVQTNFNEMKTSLNNKYSDALSALLQAQKRLPIVFAAVNKDIGLLGASMRLQDFLSNYTFEFNEEGTENTIDALVTQTKYDEATGKYIHFEKGADITLWINDIFKIYDSHNDKYIDFTSDVIPGYKIAPVLKNVEYGPEFNAHTIEIDWQCVKNTYVGQNDEKAATAHLYKSEPKSFLSGIKNNLLVSDVLNSDDNISTFTYAIPKSDTGVKADLRSQYPLMSNDRNDGVGFAFKWDEKENCAYEAFLDGTLYKSDSEWDYYQLDEKSLANSGLMISVDNGANYRRLDQLYATGTSYHEKDAATETRDSFSQAARQFAVGCIINATIRVKKNDTNHTVKVDSMSYAYANKPEEKIDLPDIPESQTSGFQITTGQWLLMESKYNEVRLFHETYKNNIFEKDMDEIKTEKILNDICMSLTAIFDTGFVITALLPSTSPKNKLVTGLYVALSVADAAFQSASYAIFRINKYNIIEKYSNEVKKFKNDPAYQALDDMLNNDKETFNLFDCEDDGGIPEDKFNAAYEETWKSITSEELLELKKHYDGVDDSGILRKYKVASAKYNLDIDKYHDELKDWDSGRKWCVATYVLLGLGLATLVGQSILGIFDPKVAAATAAKAPVEEGARAAAETSKNLYQRIWEVFKRLFSSKEVPQIVQAPQSMVKNGRLITNAKEAKEFLNEVLEANNLTKNVATDSWFSVKLANGTGKVAGKYESAQNFIDKIMVEIPTATRDFVKPGCSWLLDSEALYNKACAMLKGLKDAGFNVTIKGLKQAVEKTQEAYINSVNAANIVESITKSLQEYVDIIKLANSADDAYDAIAVANKFADACIKGLKLAATGDRGYTDVALRVFLYKV